ncbi:unnamed protein product [Meganyctiphanes norvegica]|uniref:Uncharacterized protein n=1 Tax=Meganyctiphanes norvegica TaxID=48144 RepID=A0AAV2PJ23_MEGNR
MSVSMNLLILVAVLGFCNLAEGDYFSDVSYEDGMYHWDYEHLWYDWDDEDEVDNALGGSGDGQEIIESSESSGWGPDTLDNDITKPNTLDNDITKTLLLIEHLIENINDDEGITIDNDDIGQANRPANSQSGLNTMDDDIKKTLILIELLTGNVIDDIGRDTDTHRYDID